MSLARLLFVAVMLGWPLLSQPTFEAATVKVSTPEERGIAMLVYPGGRLAATNYMLKMLLHEAYGVEDHQIDGGPKWAGEVRYSINAVPPPDSASAKVSPSNPKLPPQEEEILMLRALLAERFQLVLRDDVREANGMVLSVAGPLKLQPAKDPSAFPVVWYPQPATRQSATIYQGQTATMTMLATALSRHFEQPVQDKTGLKDAFDFRLEFAAKSEHEGPSLSSALRELGLKLESGKVPERRLTIVSAQQPGEN